MKQARIIDLPKDPEKIKEILKEALSKSFHHWIDEKATKDHPGYATRQPSKLSFDEAFEIIKDNKPHWTIYFRNVSEITMNEEDYWEFGGCNISSGEYGYVFIWIQVSVNNAKEIFSKFELTIDEYKYKNNN